MNQELIKYVMGQAAKSNVEKRQVGALIVAHHDDGTYDMVGEGYNTEEVHAEIMACEDLFNSEYVLPEGSILTCYVTHPPCPHCARTLAEHGVSNTEVVEAFMKFDGDKTRYDLIDPDFSLALICAASGAVVGKATDSMKFFWEQVRKYQRNPDNGQLLFLVCELYGYSVAQAEKEIAEVLTFGARKYKPNNWRKCSDTGRYLAAVFRHLDDWNTKGEVDEESGKLHRAHIATNLMFLFCLGYN